VASGIATWTRVTLMGRRPRLVRHLALLASTHRESSSASRHYHSPVRSCCRASGRRRGHAVSRRLPTIHGTRLEDAGPYRLEHLDREFSNGERRRFQRLHSRGHGAVIVVPMIDPGTVRLVRAPAAGRHRYALGLVEGSVDAGETPLEAANRELKEEAGYGARELLDLRQLSLAPTYMSHSAHMVIARDLYPERLPGDEPEPLEVVPWKLDALHELVLREDFSEGRSIAALFMAREWLRHLRD